jgi:ATP synthase subunit 6
MFSPLEQFEIFIINLGSFPPHAPIIYGYLPNYLLYLLLIAIVLLYFGFSYTYRTALISDLNNIFVEAIYKFIAGITSRHCGLDGLSFFPLFFITFVFVLCMNVLGLVPFSFTLTGQLIIPVVLALTFNLYFFLNGFERHGLTFLKVFVPKGVPALLLPLVVVIEIISYLLRSFSLSVRLFANMMAGHTLLYILSSFVIALSDVSVIAAMVPLILVFAVSFLEIGIACLQAYVFVVLLSIYVTDSLNPSH